MKRLIVISAFLLATVASFMSGGVVHADPSIAVSPGAAGFNSIFQVNAFNFEPNTPLTISMSTGAEPLWTIIDINVTTDTQGNAVFNIRPVSFPRINQVVQAQGSGAFVVWDAAPQQSVTTTAPTSNIRYPDPYVSFRVDQAWGFAVCDTTRCSGTQVNVGHPADRFGFAWLGGGNPANHVPAVRFAF